MFDFWVERVKSNFRHIQLFLTYLNDEEKECILTL